MATTSTATTTAIQDVEIEEEISPSLTTFKVPSSNEEYYDDRVNALRLIADSVAQQRQEASRELLTHPISIAAALAVLAVFFHNLDDLATIVTTTAGVLMAGMACVGYLTYGYLDLAEKTGTWSFLRTTETNTDKKGEGEGDEEEDILIVTKYGDDIVGALVFRLVAVSDKKKNYNNNSNNSNHKSTTFKAVIRAWTVKQRYRNKTLGTALLEEAVSLCDQNGWQGLEFALDHVNSTRILPRMFHKRLDQREAKAHSRLDQLQANKKKY